MATYSVAECVHKTLVAATADTVNLAENQSEYTEVVNRGTTGDIYFTIDGTTPTSLGDNTYYVGPGQSYLVKTGHGPDLIKLISAGTPPYSVQAAE